MTVRSRSHARIIGISAFVGLFAAVVSLGVACSDTQRFGVSFDAGAPPASQDTGTSAAPDSSDGDTIRPPTSTTRAWQWANPRPTGEALYGVGGTSKDDVWVVGAHGTVLHWDGKILSAPYAGSWESTYKGVWTSGPNDVWVFGTRGSSTEIVRWNGTSWSEQHGLDGRTLVTVSAGSSKRLIVVTDDPQAETLWEYRRDSGSWAALGESDPVITGTANDVWVDANGDAWAARSSRFFLRCRAGKDACERVAVANARIHAFGIWGSSPTDIDAFYTKEGSGSEALGVLHFDGTAWTARDDVHPLPFPPEYESGWHSPAAGTVDGRRMVFFADEILRYTPPSARKNSEPAFLTEDKKWLDEWRRLGTLGVWSAPGGSPHVVGEMGGFARFDETSSEWTEVLPSVRTKLRNASIAQDGTVLSSSKSSLLRWAADRWQSSILDGIDIRSVGALSTKDAWVATDAYMGVGRWNGSNIGTRFCCNGAVQSLWVGDKNTAWTAVLDHDPLTFEDWLHIPGRVCRFHPDGSLVPWKCEDRPHRILSISGTGPDDVWFVGDEVAHWNGKSVSSIDAFAPEANLFAGVYARGPNDVWLWGPKTVHFDGTNVVPLAQALATTFDIGRGNVLSIVANASGDLFFLVSTDAKGGGTMLPGPRTTSIYRYRNDTKELVLERAVDAPLRTLAARGDDVWATGEYGATLHFAPASNSIPH